METVGVSKLRDNMMAFLKMVQEGKTLTITSRGHEIAMIVPLKNKTNAAREALEELRKTAHVGDVLSPISEKWEAME